MSDPNQSWSGFWKGGSFRGRGIRKSRSETENVDNIGGAGCTEVEAHEIEDGKSLVDTLIIFINM